MKNFAKFLSLFILGTTLLLSCGKTTDNDNNGPDIDDPDVETQGALTDFQKVVIDYGLTTFQKAMNDGEENVLISPMSLETALYMAMNGTDGKTLEEFRTALKAEQFFPNGINTHYKTLIEKLVPKNESTQLGIENTVFYDEKMVTFHDSFRSTIGDVFDADFTQANFADDSSVDLINNWAKDKTEGRIDKILDKIQADEALFLINALFFKADWDKGFEALATTEQDFTKENQEEVTVDLMYSDDQRRFYQGDEFSAVDLKFSDDEFSMTFVLPANGVSTLGFVNGFSESEFYNFYIDLYDNLLQEGRVVTKLPRFEISAHKNMKDILVDMGMETAFETADLSRMGTFPGNTYFSRILHDTFLKIDEKGAEGAAVTTVGVGVESVPPTIEFKSPFLFVIRHVETNTPIFIGKLGNPE